MQYQEVEIWFHFWLLLKQSETVPRDVILAQAGISEGWQFEILVAMDSAYNRAVAEMRERERAQQT